MADTPQFVATPRTAIVKFANADATVPKTLLTMGASGGLIEGIFVTSNDTTSRGISLLLSSGGIEVFIDTVFIPAATVQVPVQKVNILDVYRLVWIDPNNIKWVLGANAVINVRMEAPVSLGSFETAAVCNYGEF